MIAFRLVRTAIVVCATAAAALAANTVGLQSGKVVLKSAGPLAFGPDGVLFVGDSLGASIVALDTGHKSNVKQAAAIEIKPRPGNLWVSLNPKQAPEVHQGPVNIASNDTLPARVRVTFSRASFPACHSLCCGCCLAGSTTNRATPCS